MRKRGVFKVVLVLVLFFLVIGGTAGLIAFANRPKGVVVLDASLTDEERTFLDGIFTEGRYRKDLVITAETVTELGGTAGTANGGNAGTTGNGSSEAASGESAGTTGNGSASNGNELVYNIEVPVKDFYYDGEVEYISLSELDGSKRLQAQDGVYFLDSFTSGAKFRILKVSSEDAEEKTAAEAKIREKLPSFPAKDTTLTLNQTGVTALTRGMGTKLNQVGDASYFAENIKDLLSSSDLTHISNEVSFTDDCSVGSESVVLCADNRMIDAITAIGTDIIELTGNHNTDNGAAASRDTLKVYESLGLKTFGGGADAESARVPLEIDQKSTKITWLGYNLSTTKAGAGGATDSLPGANIYDEETARTQISEAKARGDFVIVDIQYYECYCYPDGFVEYETCDYPIHPGESEWPDQEEFFKHLIDLGADMVAGTQAHQPQIYELYNGKPIYYGLGNLFFDQVYWPGTERSLILTHYFYNGKLLQTKITPTVYDSALQTTPMGAEEAEAFLDRLARKY